VIFPVKRLSDKQSLYDSALSAPCLVIDSDYQSQQVFKHGTKGYMKVTLDLNIYAVFL